MSCLFCDIVEGKIPSQKVFENERIYAFKDISPQSPFHVLIIPKQHIESAMEIDSSNSAVIAEVFEVAAQLAKEYNLEKGFRIVNNCGEDGAQTVKHLHFHMLGGRQLAWPPG